MQFNSKTVCTFHKILLNIHCSFLFYSLNFFSTFALTSPCITFSLPQLSKITFTFHTNHKLKINLILVHFSHLSSEILRVLTGLVTDVFIFLYTHQTLLEIIRNSNALSKILIAIIFRLSTLMCGRERE